jgi:prepilin-type N-terminal cleavage/methylation domain-containing protein
MRTSSATNRAPVRQRFTAAASRSTIRAPLSAVASAKEERSTIAFTLIELLTVISIIAILAGLLLPTLKTAMVNAEKAKAQTAIAGLSIAIKHYYTEYGKWPIAYVPPAAPPATYEDFVVDGWMVLLLSGKDVGLVPPAPVLLPPTPAAPERPRVHTAGGIIPVPAGTEFQGNPRNIVFMEFKKADLDSDGGFKDPWGRPYHFRLDVNYQNNIDNPYFVAPPPATADTPVTTVGFLIWSVGPDGQYNGQYNGVTTDHYGGLNKDNVKSW